MKTFLSFSFVICIFFSSLAQKSNQDNPEFFLRTARKKLAVVLEAGQFKSGEKIADIGTGNGWFAAALGIYTDSLSFVLEDIGSTFMKDGRFEQAMKAYKEIKGGPITNKYTWKHGTKKSTTLPFNSFDKVLLIDTYHHMDYRENMIRDICSISKSSGKVIVMEPVARKTGKIYKGCNSVVFTPDEIINSFHEQGFTHERTLKTVKSTGQRVRVFVFGKS